MTASGALRGLGLRRSHPQRRFPCGSSTVEGRGQAHRERSAGAWRTLSVSLRGLCVLYALSLAGCALREDTGPAAVTWDRDACQECGMVLSDRHFAAQVRGGPKRHAFKFDDIGCAVRWLEKQPWGNDEATRVWVARAKDGTWLDARAARFIGGRHSPMGFGFAAIDSDGTSGNSDGGLSFAALRAQLARAPRGAVAP